MMVFDDYGGVRDVRLTLERTVDPELILSVITQPEILPHIWDQPGLPPVPLHPQIYHLAAHLQGELAGVVTFVPVNSVTWNPHISMLVQGRGLGTDFMGMACQWMFSSTDCRKLVAHPPVFKTAMIRVFEKCGFQKEGLSPDSFLFNGILHDRLLMGIGKDKVCGPQH